MIPERAIVFDTESTGFSPASGDRMVEMAAIELINGVQTGKKLYGVYWPQRAVPERVAQIHGWSTSKLRGKPLFREQAEEVNDFFSGAQLWAHNSAFDAKFLNAEMKISGFKNDWDVSCSLKLARKVLPKQSFKLADLAVWADHVWTGQAHSAMADADALVCVLQKLWTIDPALVQEKIMVPKPVKKVKSNEALPAWTGSVAPANDPRLVCAVWNGHPFAKGKPWLVEEEIKLRQGFVEGSNLQELAQIHGRTPAALALRLEQQGLIGDNHPYAMMRRR